jgi:hypothetical protein
MSIYSKDFKNKVRGFSYRTTKKEKIFANLSTVAKQKIMKDMLSCIHQLTKKINE